MSLVAIGNPPESDLEGRGIVEAIAGRVLHLPLRAADFQFSREAGWTRGEDASFTGVSLRVVHRGSDPGLERGGISLTFGWRYDAFGDPFPEPRTAEGCIRQMSIDDFVGAGTVRLSVLPDVSSSEEMAAWEQRLAMVVRKHVVRWLDVWKRPAGYRDFLSAQRLHLAAGWLSALLGQGERADFELRSAAALNAIPLDEGFDRRQADRDESFAAPLAARHGLASVLESAEQAGDRRTIDAFGGERGARASDRVTNPGREHARLLRRHEVYAALCAEHVGQTPTSRGIPPNLGR